ncbi:hypothetical protein HNP55_004420 [Paucibacter oligotrophus]|uniref:CHAT domain-containing protein n=1 Tax=Roseateles oligotrophus TaxID=1769250 RepID=A0A840LCI1_9BURK|nr:hypothetical protein [Roseateles oligotrophus]
MSEHSPALLRQQARTLLAEEAPASLPIACKLAELSQATQEAQGAQAPALLNAQAFVIEAMVVAQQLDLAMAWGPGLFKQIGQAGPEGLEGTGRVALALAAAHHARDEVEKALAWSTQALQAMAARAADFDAREYWTAQINHAVYLTAANQRPEAEALLQSIYAALQDQAALRPQLAQALRALTFNAARSERLADATRYAQQEVELRQRHLAHLKADLAGSLQNLATLLSRKGSFQEAEAAFRSLLSQFQPEDPDPAHIRPGILENFAGLLNSRGKFQEALEMSRAAEALLQAGPLAQSPRAARALRRMASAQMNLGQWGDALKTLQRCIGLLEASGQRADQPTALAAHLALSRVFLNLGDVGEAALALKTAEQHLQTEGALPSQLGHFQLLKADVMVGLDQPAAAYQALLDAETAFARIYPDKHDMRLFLLGHRCRLEPGDCPALQAFLKQWDESADDVLSPSTEALMSLALSVQERRQQHSDKAYAWAARALAAGRAGSMPNLEWRAFEALALSARAQGQAGEAIAFAKQAVNILQAMRSNLLSLNTNKDSGFVRNKLTIYRQLADWLAQAGRIAEALEVMQLVRLREQDDFAQRALATEMPALSLTPGEQALQAALEQHFGTEAEPGETRQRMLRLLVSERLSPAEKEELKTWMQGSNARRAAELQTLAQLLQQARVGKSEPTAAPSLTSTDAKTLHAHFLLGDDFLSILSSQAGTYQLQRQALDGRQLKQDIARFLQLLQERGDTLPLAQRLYQQLGLQIDLQAQAQGKHQIRLWLDGSLRYLPLGALHDGKQYLAQKYRLVLAGAAPAETGTEGWPAQALDHPGRPRLQGFGLTQAWPGYAALPGVAEEASHWKVDDRQTAALMRRFYAELAKRPADYAGALQRAQTAALQDRRLAYTHPYYWAAFTLVEAGAASAHGKR